MSRKRTNTQLEAARRELEQAWENWERRPEPSTTLDMSEFYDWMRSARPDLLDYRDPPVGDEQWQQVKYWLIDYQVRRGRSY